MATSALGRPRLTAERRFYLGMATAVLVIIFAGFAPSYYLRGIVPAAAPLLPMTPLVHLHGVLFTGWVLLFMAQVGLVSAGQAAVHRQLGLLGFAMVAAMIVVGTLAALHGVARASGPPFISPLSWLAVPLFDVPVFGGLIAAALYNRGKPQVHKRLMLAATIALLPPGIGRASRLLPDLPLPVVIIGTLLLFMGALAIWDRKSLGRIHGATIVATVVVVGSWLLRFAVWQTGPWLDFARWASSLV